MLRFAQHDKAGLLLSCVMLSAAQRSRSIYYLDAHAKLEFSMSTRYRHIEVSGPPCELGRQLGEAARDEIRGFAAIALERVNKTVPISRTRAMDISRQSMDCAAAYAPDMLEELRGMSEGAGVALDEMMLLQVRNQLCPEETRPARLCHRPPAQRRGAGDCRAELGQRPRAGPLHDRADAPPGWQTRADERHPSGPHRVHWLQRPRVWASA